MATLTTDPIDWALDSSGDLLIVNGDLAFISGVAAVAQDIRIALQMIKGEWFADLDDGIPYLEREGVPANQALLGQRFNEGLVRDQFSKAILGVPNVASLDSLVISFDHVTRKLTVSWRVTTAFGDTISDTLATGA